MGRYKHIILTLSTCAIIWLMIKGPVYINIFAKNDVITNVSDENKSLSTNSENVKLIEGTNKDFSPDKVYRQVQGQNTTLVDPLDSIRRDCGHLCNTSRAGIPGMYFNHVTAPVDCTALFKNEYIDRTHGLKQAPKKIPDELMKEFTMNGRLKVNEWYFDQQYLGKKAKSSVWTIKTIEQMLSDAKNGTLGGNYGSGETNALRDGLKHAPGVKDGRVLVIGSEIPWVEACILEAGAKEIVTLEYGEIKSEHPQIKAMTPLQFRKKYLSDQLGKFDAIVTFSSVEHSGLGRYGDALNPWGDIIAIARAWCVTKKGGSLTIGVQYDYNNDYITFNAHRWYGKVRFPYLATNWKQLYRGDGGQRVHVFTNGESESHSDIRHYLKEPHPYKHLNNTNTKFAQAKQDQTVYKIFPKQNGFFIEMGAFDGVKYSNTLWLERHHNWTGLLIEANPDLCDQIDNNKRTAWRLCGCIASEKSATFIKGGTLGGAMDTTDKDHIQKFDQSQKITVPCFTMVKVLDKIGHLHVDFFSLDVEGSELFVLDTMKIALKSGKITVDVWSIDFRVWNGSKIVIAKSKRNLESIRMFFEEVGGYVEHSKLSSTRDTSDEKALDVIFVSVKTWCKKNWTLPNGSAC